MTPRSRFVAGSAAIACVLAAIAASGFALGGDAHFFKRGTWCAYVLAAPACAAVAARMATARGLAAWQGRPFALASAVVLAAYVAFLLVALVVTTVDHSLVFAGAPQFESPNLENVAFVMFFLTLFTAAAGLVPALAFEYLFSRRALRRGLVTGAAP